MEDNKDNKEGFLSLPDIRNKLGPIKNLIAMIENNKNNSDIINKFLSKEIENCKRSINYLSGNEKL